MKEVRAIVRPQRINRVREALRQIPNFPGITVFNAEGFTAPAATNSRSIREELTDFTPKLVVSVLCGDDMVEKIVDTIIRHGQTGQIGDGLVWVVPITGVKRVRDGTRLMLDPSSND